MAIKFRYGSNGSYKSACGTCCEIVPALIEGRVVVTNIEGFKKLEDIEKVLLKNKVIKKPLPETARIVRISTRTPEGIHLFQNWFCWLPIGAMLVIDECQDVFCKEEGFKKMEDFLLKPFEEFEELLPPYMKDLFYSAWEGVTEIPESEIDDCGRSQFDENGRLLYPNNFKGAFMRHRKYNWDILMLTPDYGSIDASIKGCAEIAISHKNTDMPFRKRRPRIMEHLPKENKTSAKKDDLIFFEKVPKWVFELYSSTGTGKNTKSGQGNAIFRQPKLYFAALLIIISFGACGYKLIQLVASDEDSTEQTISETSNDTTQETIESPIVLDRSNVIGMPSETLGVVSYGVNNINKAFPYIKDIKSIYVSSVNTVKYNDGSTRDELLFKITTKNGHDYWANEMDIYEAGFLFNVQYSGGSARWATVTLEKGDERYKIAQVPYEKREKKDKKNPLAVKTI